MPDVHIERSKPARTQRAVKGRTGDSQLIALHYTAGRLHAAQGHSIPPHSDLSDIDDGSVTC